MDDKEKYIEWKQKYDAECAAAKVRREEQYGTGNVWTTDEAITEFEFESFLAPCAFVRRKRDNMRGTLMFDHSPRVYYGFEQRR